MHLEKSEFCIQFERFQFSLPAAIKDSAMTPSKWSGVICDPLSAKFPNLMSSETSLGQFIAYAPRSVWHHRNLHTGG